MKFVGHRFGFGSLPLKADTGGDGKPTLDLTWNGLYQLVSVSTNGVFAEGYAYDALGRRVSTTTAEGTTRHVYDDNWQVIADIDEQGNAIVSYTWGAGIDNLLAVKIGGATYYPLTDIQGTVWGYVDTQNDIVARWQYDAWGNVVDEEIASDAAALASLRYRFQGREWSVATGLINFRMRWYDAETGCWLSKDPIGLSGGMNVYAFCGNKPVNSTDPSGLAFWVRFGGFFQMIGGAAEAAAGAIFAAVTSETGFGAVGGCLVAAHGTDVNSSGVTVRSALPLDGNTGGLIEVLVPNPGSQIFPITSTPINPPF
jgi:RHS repeat-associated protein